MTEPADFELDRERGRVLALSGDWTAMGVGRAGMRLERALKGANAPGVDISNLKGFDTAGALALIAAGVSVEGVTGRADVERLMSLVGGLSKKETAVPDQPHSAYAMLVRGGQGVEKVLLDAYQTLAFIGHVCWRRWAM